MCIIIHKPLGIKIETEVIDKAVTANDDGWGFIIRFPNGKLDGWRNMCEVGLDKAKDALQNELLEVTFHARIATHGTKTIDQTHPFQMWGNSWLFHNGILTEVGSPDQTNSDTWHFAKKLEEGFTGPEQITEGVKTLLELYARSERSKLLIMTPSETLIFNREAGNEKDGAWFSNFTAHPASKVYAAGNYGNWPASSAGYGGTLYTKSSDGTVKKLNTEYNYLTDTWERSDYDTPVLGPAVTENSSLIAAVSRIEDLLDSYQTMPWADVINQSYSNPLDVAMIIALDSGRSIKEILEEVQADPEQAKEDFVSILYSAGTL